LTSIIKLYAFKVAGYCKFKSYQFSALRHALVISSSDHSLALVGHVLMQSVPWVKHFIPGDLTGLMI